MSGVRAIALLVVLASAPLSALAAGLTGAPTRGAGGCSLAGVFWSVDEASSASPGQVFYLPYDVRLRRTEAGTPEVRAFAFQAPDTHEEVVFATVLLEFVDTIARFACVETTYPAADHKPLPVLSVSLAFAPRIAGLTGDVQGDRGAVDAMVPRKWVSTRFEGAALRSSVRQELLSTVPSLAGNVRWRVQDLDGSEVTFTTPLVLPLQDHRAILAAILEAL